MSHKTNLISHQISHRELYAPSGLGLVDLLRVTFCDVNIDWTVPCLLPGATLSHPRVTRNYIYIPFLLFGYIF